MKVVISASLTVILDGSVAADRKGWFVLIRKAWENYGDDRVVDEFSTPKSSFRAWVCL